MITWLISADKFIIIITRQIYADKFVIIMSNLFR